MDSIKTIKTQFDISELLENGLINNELHYERAMIADKKLRVLSKENPKLKPIRKKLRDLIEQYENKNWSINSAISVEKLGESEAAEWIAERERIFIQ